MILIDSHAHLYACFSTDVFLEWSRKNFQKAAESFGPNAFQGVLFLLDAPGTRAFPDSNFQKKTSAWRFFPTEETVSIRAQDNSGRTLFLITGKQVVSRERLEVLALGCRNAFPPDLPLEVLLKRIGDKGGIPGVPWGFGKWLGNRGRVLDRVLSETMKPVFFLGENGGRPGIFPTPSVMKKAERKGISILRGSDPLPIPSEVKRPGSFGFMIPETLDPSNPFAHFLHLIGKKETQRSDYGEAMNLFDFLLNQKRMAAKKIKI